MCCVLTVLIQYIFDDAQRDGPFQKYFTFRLHLEKLSFWTCFLSVFQKLKRDKITSFRTLTRRLRIFLSQGHKSLLANHFGRCSPVLLVTVSSFVDPYSVCAQQSR